MTRPPAEEQERMLRRIQEEREAFDASLRLHAPPRASSSTSLLFSSSPPSVPSDPSREGGGAQANNNNNDDEERSEGNGDEDDNDDDDTRNPGTETEAAGSAATAAADAAVVVAAAAAAAEGGEGGGGPPGGGGSEREAAEEGDDGEVVGVPDDIQLAEFKSQVRMYIEMDNAIKRLQVMLKDRRAYKQQLADRMIKFMTRYNIEDLDTPDGSIRSQVTHAKAPLPQWQIRDNIAAFFTRRNAPDLGMQLTDTLFNNRERVERVRLRRNTPNASRGGGPGSSRRG